MVDAVKFKPNDDKVLCAVSELNVDDAMWVMWHKDGFTNIMPKSGFILANEEQE